MAPRRTTGLGFVLLVALAPLGALLPGWVVSGTDFLYLLRPEVPSRGTLLGALIGGHGLLALAQLFGVRRASRLPRGQTGRTRALLLSFGGLLLALSSVALSFALDGATQEVGSTPVFGMADFFDVAGPWGQAMVAALVNAGVFAALTLAALLACFFLIPERVRSRLWWIIDISLVAATAFTTWKFDLRPQTQDPAALLGPSLRLGSTVLLSLRVFVRALPYLLDLIEHIDVRSLVASRHLRAKKSGFLAAISGLSILAVTLSCCALSTTLSVMGGFRQDLKRKILGNNAHIVLAPGRGTFEGGEQVVQALDDVPGIVGVSPFVSGEVMVSSASNLAGAVLRGIDPDRIGEVTDLPGNMRNGGLDYLRHPERLLELPTDILRLSVPPGPKVMHLKDEDDAPEAKATRGMLEDLDRMLEGVEGAGEDEANAEDAEAGAPNTAGVADNPTDLLPGVIVGQELARSLRLYLGDEVNIVSPLGTLGPTGPMPKSRPFRVAGIFYTGMYEYDMKFIYALLPTAQRFLSTQGLLHGVEIKVERPDDAPEIADRIEAAVGRPDLHAKPWQELNKNLFGALALERLAMFIALGIAILVASFCIIGTLTLMVQEKGREVAILKAMGARDGAIVGVFVLEGTLIGVFGAALGLCLGYALCFAAEHFGIRLNPEVYYIDRLPVHIDPVEFAGVGVAAVLVCLLVTVYPALLASRLRPVEALRYE